MLPLSLSLPTPHAKFRALGKLRAPVFLHAPSRRHPLASRGERGVAKRLEGADLVLGCCCLQATNVASRQQFVAVQFVSPNLINVTRAWLSPQPGPGLLLYSQMTGAMLEQSVTYAT